MAGDDDDKGKEPTPKPSTEEAGAGDTSGEDPGKTPPTPEGQGKPLTPWSTLYYDLQQRVTMQKLLILSARHTW